MTVHTASALEGIVVADANTATLVARYAEAKRAAEEADKCVALIRKSLLEKFEAANADKFSDELGDVILARVEVKNAEQVDIPMLKRLAPAIFAQVVKPRGTHYRLNTPSIRR